MTARLQNVSGGVRGFFGAQSISKDGKIPGFRIAPGEKKALLPEQVAALKDASMPHARILAHYLKNGDLLDLDDAFGSPLSEYEKNAPAPAEDANENDGPDEQRIEKKLANLSSLAEEAALAAVLDESDLNVLKQWFLAEDRASVKEQINKRGEYIVNQANAARKKQG